MQLTPILDRLNTHVTALRQTGGAADLAAARDDLRIAPAAYVIPLRETPGRNELGEAIWQRVTVRLGLVLAVRNVRDARGEAAAEDLEALRQSVRAALLGWAPAMGHDPLEYGGGRLLALTNAILWWQDDFTTAFYMKT